MQQIEDLRVFIKKSIEKQYRTTEEFCNKNEISSGLLYRFLRGKRNVTLINLCRIAEALDKKVKLVKSRD